MAINVSMISVNTPASKLWKVITDPAFVKSWQYGSDLETSWEVGAPIRFKTAWENNVFEQWGIVLEYQPFKVLRYTLFAPRPGMEDSPENYFEMIYQLTESGATTLLKIIQEDNRPGAVQEPLQGEENEVLKGLKALAEAG